MSIKIIKGKRILITGGAGFVGSHIASALAPENEVIVLDDLSVGKKENLSGIDAELVIGSIRDADKVREVMKGVDLVFHEAAIASVPKSILDPIACNQVNVCGTLRVLTEARDAKVGKVVFASSSAVYGDSLAEMKREDDLPAPISPYAVTKLTGEHYCKNFWLNFRLPTCSLRYFNIYGPGQDPSSDYAAVVPRFIEAAVKGGPLNIFGDGENTRDFVYIDDVVQANVLAALDNEHNGQVFNIANQVRVSVNQLAHMILKNFPSDVKSKVEHKDARKGDIKHSMADISKAMNELGYSPKFDMNKGLALTINSMR
ncbi:MAG: NAD-dependent epimerase/dehydratase family protein [Methanomassiliicoccales archaeon]|nr:NAD-dependent epimerase/dehydratase family protein [Methanomassiliicoccales archaeon]